MLQISKRAGYLCFLMKDFYTCLDKTLPWIGKMELQDKEVWPVEADVYVFKKKRKSQYDFIKVFYPDFCLLMT